MFVGHIVSPVIELLSDHPSMSSLTHEMYIPQCERGVLEVPHQLEIRQFRSI